ncbi:DUF4136 domain-containing protein [Marinobacteraceae bacterium S3BR75-40.1]
MKRLAPKVRTFPLFLLALTTLLSACASMVSPEDVMVEYRPETDFSQYRTFQVESVPIEARGTQIHQMITQALTEQLQEKGLEPADRDQADLLVRYATKLEQSERLTTDYIPYEKGMTTRYGLQPYMEGSLLINMVDRASDQVVWKAVKRRELQSMELKGVTQERVSESVADLLDDFPPGQGLW